MQKLTPLEYGIIMQAINNAKCGIAEQTFIDPYDNEDEITHEQASDALHSVETKLQAHYLK